MSNAIKMYLLSIITFIGCLSVYFFLKSQQGYMAVNLATQQVVTPRCDDYTVSGCGVNMTKCHSPQKVEFLCLLNVAVVKLEQE